MARESSWLKEADAWRYNAPREEIGLPLRILIDARKLNHGGIGVYLDNLISSLVGSEHSKVSVLADSAQVASFKWATDVEVIEERSKLYSLDELISLPRRVNFHKFDIYHTPHYLLPYSIPIPSVVTIHDLIHVLHPERWYYPVIAKRLIKSTLKRASLILTVSEAVRADILGLYVNNREIQGKLKVISNTLGADFLRNSTDDSQIGKRFGISGSYLLSVISLHKRHKGVRDLLQAFKELNNSPVKTNQLGLNSTKVSLVIVGQGAKEIRKDPNLRGLLDQMPMVRLIGEVNKKDLISLYRGALALVVPSTTEGFSLPVLEAHAIGIPVVTRPVPAIMEQLSPSDIICENMSVDALRKGMEGVLSRDLSIRWGKEPLEQQILERYSRENFANAIFQAYSEIVKTARGLK